MADDIAALKQLQAGLNAAFDELFKAAEQDPNNSGAVAAGKQKVGELAQATIGTALGPAFSIIGLSSQIYLFAAVRTGIDLDIFKTVTKPTTLDELKQKTGADPDLLLRILRAISSAGFLKQTSMTEWAPTPLTFALNVPALNDWVKTHFDQRVVVCGHYPEWLKKTGYKTTGTIHDNVFSDTMGEELWDFYEKRPEYHATFDSAMSIQESFPPEMLPPYPFSGDIGDLHTDPDAVTLVDIGGGFGQAIKKLHSTYPGIKGRFILQDLPKTINQIDVAQAKKDGFEPTVHDFFDEQPIKGAKFYHMRRVLHDWNDGPSLKILEAARAAMKDTPDYSRLLVHDFVLPDVDCGFSESMVDLMMMQVTAGKERTESQWHELLGKAGFKIVKIWRAAVGTTAVIEAAIA